MILADCGDSGVLIGKDGKYGFDDLDHAVFSEMNIVLIIV